ncbi:MAG: hypothetical protein HOC20_10330 [Chloroflexi bacterium]|nr:hypothetical protein [Chloroflexota bacterium]
MVFERETQNPVAGAGVWAVTWDEARTLRGEVAAIKSNDAVAAQAYDYESMCDLYGEFLGKTDDDGQLNHVFDETGKHFLVAVKDGYYPGFSPLTVRTIPRALGIKAPKVAGVSEDVTMTVYQRLTHDPIEGAGVWAFSKDDAETVRTEVTNIRSEIKTDAQQYDYESLMNAYGEYLGRTNSEGQLMHAFDQTGKYVLVTWKMGYWPGFGSINIKDQRPALAIRAPRYSQIGQEITMTVCERPNQPGLAVSPISMDNAVKVPSIVTETGLMAVSAEKVNPVKIRPNEIDFEAVCNPVEGAGVWAIPRDDTESLKKEIEDRVTNSEIASTEYDYESLLNSFGEFLGRTDSQGKLTHEFDEGGNYVLVTWKQGYRPGFALHTVKSVPRVLSIKSTRVAPVNQTVTMTAFERNTHNPVAGADIWAFSWDQSESVRGALSDIEGMEDVGSQELDYESIASGFGGMYLGETGDNGEMVYAFGDAGRYLLLVLKDGYWPGFGQIKIRDLQPIESTEIEQLVIQQVQ